MAIDWTSLLTGVLQTAGTNYLANRQIDASTAAAQAAAQAAQFRPVGVTTRFGTSGFNYDPTTGQLIGAGYQAAPDVAAMREGLMGLAGSALSQAATQQTYQPTISQQAQGLFSLGGKMLPTTGDVSQMEADYITRQKALLEPQREQQLAGIRNQLQQTGRAGLATGATTAGNLAATNPEMAAYYNAVAQQDAQIAAQAASQARNIRAQDIAAGTGLLSNATNLMGQGYALQGQALQPFSSSFTAAQGVEQAGLQPLTLGASLGSSAAQAGAQAAGASRPFTSTALGLQEQNYTAMANALRDPIAQLIKGLTGG